MRFPRASGVLLHPTSLPGPQGSGDFGPAAYHFVDWLVGAGQKLWQILPLGGIGPGNSPYMSTSAFAGNVLLIDLAELQQRGWLQAADLVGDAAFNDLRLDFATVVPCRHGAARLGRAELRAVRVGDRTCRLRRVLRAPEELARRLRAVHDLANLFGWRDWSDWDAPLARRDPAALRRGRARARRRHRASGSSASGASSASG